MPGYLTNRYINLNVSADLEDLDTTLTADINALEVRMTEAEGNIEDLQLNIGV
jgi:hypothetical protein